MDLHRDAGFRCWCCSMGLVVLQLRTGRSPDHTTLADTPAAEVPGSKPDAQSSGTHEVRASFWGARMRSDRCGQGGCPRARSRLETSATQAQSWPALCSCDRCVTFGPIQVQIGMEVIGTTGARIGHVKEAHDDDFVIDRGSESDVRLGYDKIRAMLGDQIVLSIGPDQLERTN